MNLTDALTATPRVRKGPPCSVAVLLAEMPEAKAEAFAELLARPHASMPGSFIARAVREEGYYISGETVQRHRRGDCICGTVTT